MVRNLFRSVVLTVALLLGCGLVYPVAGWALAQLAFHAQANGSVTANGSLLIGQPWNNGTSINPQWFNGRPDADNPLELNAIPGTSGASNLGPRSRALELFVRKMISEWRAVGVWHPTPDLVTSSGSGLDPNISRADAMAQVSMIAHARALAPATLRALINSEVRSAQFGFLGQATINVLELNEALAKLAS